MYQALWLTDKIQYSHVAVPFSPRIMVYIRNDYAKQFSINFAFSDLAYLWHYF